mgnify:FL=1
MAQNYKFIIFDCDGVLVDSEILYLEIERQHLASAGLTYGDEEYIKRFMGTGPKAYEIQARQDYKNRFGTDLAGDFFDLMHMTIHSEFEKNLTAVAGIDSVLGNLQSLDIAVASSSGLDFLKQKLGWVRLNQYFGDHIYSAEQVSNPKPEPDLFLFVAKALGADPRQCIVVEDSPNGVRAARAAGMTAIGFTGGRHCGPDHAGWLKEYGADLVCRDAPALSEALAS